MSADHSLKKMAGASLSDRVHSGKQSHNEYCGNYDRSPSLYKCGRSWGRRELEGQRSSH